jgi:hydrophobic/amphiphilic exporter-1 (mainly G- bacteria), HAE1 family
MLLAKLSINRPIMMTMVILVFIVFGALAFQTLKLNNMPEVQIPFVTVQTVYPGAGPKEIETQISKKLEDEIATVGEIKDLKSYSLDGVSIIMIEFQLSKDVDVAYQEVKAKVDKILNDLPADAKLPIVDKVDLQAFPVMDIVLSGDLSPTELYDLADKKLKDRFAQVRGVGIVNLVGGQEREIHINMDNRVVYENYISLPQMLQLFSAQNMDLPGGYLKVDDQELTVRLSGKYKTIEEMQNMEIPTAFGIKKLRQVATVEDAGKNIRERAIYFDNKKKTIDENVVRMSLVKSTEGNAVEISELVNEMLPKLREELPEGVQLSIISDQSKFVKSTVDDTISNIFLGVLFTSLVLLFFLHDIRSTLIVALSMPASIIATFLGMQMLGFSLNTLSLMGISVSVGVLVSNSIVVLENIFRQKSLGLGSKMAAFIGTKEVAVAVIAATMTNIAVFLPLASMQGMVGLFMIEMALTAAVATIFSLVMSFTLTPMLAALILPAEQKVGPISRVLIKFENMWARLYQNALRFILNKGYRGAIVVLGAFGFFIFTVFYYATEIGGEFMAITDQGQIKIEIELPVGYNLDATSEKVKEIQHKLENYEEITHFVANVGRMNQMDIGTNVAMLEVHLVDKKYREKGLGVFIEEFMIDLVDVSNAKIRVDILEAGPGSSAPIEFYLVGQDLETLESLKEEMVVKLQNITGMINFTNSSKKGKPEITIYPKRTKLAETGMTVQQLAITLRAAIEGMETANFTQHGNDYDIKLTLSDESVTRPEDIGNITLVSEAGKFRLSELADVVFSTGYTKILHKDKFTSVQFTASNAPGVATGDITTEIQRIIDEEMDIPYGYGIQWSGMSQMEKEAAEDFGFAFALAMLLTYMLLAAILESFIQPILILTTLPLAFIGVFILMYYTDTNLGITAQMGFIMLLGIVVNNAILILDYTNQLMREKKMSAKDALIEASPIKLKPIIMSTVAIILGMLPMALGMGDAGSEIRQPLGIVSIGGLVTSTFLTLFVIPCVFLFNHKVMGFFSWFLHSVLKIKESVREPEIE